LTLSVHKGLSNSIGLTRHENLFILNSQPFCSVLALWIWSSGQSRFLAFGSTPAHFSPRLKPSPTTHCFVRPSVSPIERSGISENLFFAVQPKIGAVSIPRWSCSYFPSIRANPDCFGGWFQNIGLLVSIPRSKAILVCQASLPAFPPYASTTPPSFGVCGSIVVAGYLTVAASGLLNHPSC